MTFSRTSTDEPLISGGTSGVTQVNGPGSVGGCSEAVKSPCRLSIWTPRSSTWWWWAPSRPALLRTLAEGAYLHDVGKVGIPDHVLNVAVADVWDALTSDRAYRPACPPDRALRHMERGRGTTSTLAASTRSWR